MTDKIQKQGESKMEKNVATRTLLPLITGMLSQNRHRHVGKEATCTEPKTCMECRETEGSQLGHAISK